MINLLYVDDNRDVLNWGCRATSISLSQLLKREYCVQAVINKRTVDTKIPTGLGLIRRCGSYDIWQRALNICSKSAKLAGLCNIKQDFLSMSPSSSLSNFLKQERHNRTLHSIYEKASTADAILINGEGSMIFTTPPRRDLLFQLMMIDLGTVHFKKPVFYVNAMMSDCTVNGRNEELAMLAVQSLIKCRGVTFRDKFSFELAKSLAPDLDCSLVPDALFTWQGYLDNIDNKFVNNGDFIIPFPEQDNLFGELRFDKPYVCLGGSSYASRNKKAAIQAFAGLAERLKKLGLRTYLVETCTGDNFLSVVSELTGVPLIPVNVPILSGGAILANARVFVSGRYHPSILASLGGTPCVFLGSNSHKTRSLQEVMEYENIIEYSAIPSDRESDRIVDMAKDIIAKGISVRERIKIVARKRSEEAEILLDIIEKGLVRNGT